MTRETQAKLRIHTWRRNRALWRLGHMGFVGAEDYLPEK
jgi:hypothetical protein